jgi:GT2 family glycosyltransferase
VGVVVSGVVHAVTIHHRGREMLDICLRSLLESTDAKPEIVVVLNGCDEELPDIVESSSRIHVVDTGEPVGFSAANNIGVAWAKRRLGAAGAYYFVNNDTRSEPDSLARQLDALNAAPNTAVVGPTLLIEWAPDHLNSLGLNVTDDAWGWDEGIGIALADYGPLPQRRQVVAVTGSAMLVDAEVYDRVGGWTELYDYYFEDIDLCLKIRNAGFDVVHEPTAVVGHHVSATMTLGSDHKFYLFYRNRLLLAAVHWPLLRFLGVWKLAMIDEILGPHATETTTRKRAVRGAFAKLPAALAARWRNHGRKDWFDLLKPRGSVPVITLPEDPRTEIEDEVEVEVEVEDEAETTPPPEARRIAADFEIADRGGRRVMVLGCAPLPFENQRMNYAPGGRTWQIAESLVADGHTVAVVAMRIPGAYGETSEPFESFVHDGAAITTIVDDLFREPGIVDAAVEAFRPEVLIGASSTVPALRAVEVADEIPVWVDLFGDLVSEAQARIGVHPDEELAPYRDVLVALLERGDAFSAVSERQRATVLGQLGLAGRLNRANRGYELVHTVPVSLPPDEPGADGEGDDTIPGVEDGDVVVLWSGGFNTWCDPDTLFGGVERAMAADDRIRFVATGGSIKGHDDSTYDGFLRLVEGSPYRDRFTPLGPLPATRAAAVRRRADLGVVTERRLVERELGSSGRVLAWLSHGLPVVCTAISELGATLAKEDLVTVYRSGDPDDLARAILEIAADRGRARVRAERARVRARELWNVAATTAPIRCWVRDARRAPDAEIDNPLALTPALEAERALPGTIAELNEERAHCQREHARFELAHARFEREHAEFEKLCERYHEVRSELGSIHQSKMWKIWMAYLNVLGPFRRRR